MTISSSKCFITLRYSLNLSLVSLLPASGALSVMTYFQPRALMKLAMALAITVSEGMVRKNVEYLTHTTTGTHEQVSKLH